MTLTPTAVRRNLRAIPPERARLQTELIAALNSREVEELHTSARLASARDRRAANAWIDFSTPRGRVAVAPLLVDGTLAKMTAGDQRPDGAAAAATLGRIEPLVAALETGLGVELQPAGLSDRVDDEAMMLVRLDAIAVQGGMRHRIIVAVSPEMEVSPLPLPTRMPALVAGLKPRWTAAIAGPALTAQHLAALGPGDLILLGIGNLVTKLSLPGRNDVLRACIRWRDSQLLVEEGAAPGERVSRMDGAGGSEPEGQPDWQAVHLPTTIEFDGAGLTAAELATLGKGSVLPLPAQGGTLAVRVRAGDTVVADGELVAVGDGFGVLVTALRTQG